jgi:hypothetical protein
LFTIAPPHHSRRMQGLSPKHLDDSQSSPTGTPEGSPHHTEVPVVTPPHRETSDVPVVTTPPPQVERTDSLEDFRITNTREDYRIRRGEQPFVRLNSSDEAIGTSSESTVGPSPGVVGQDPFWSGDFRRVLFGTESPTVYEINPPVSSETETTPETTTYHFVLPPEMAHLANTTSVQTGITAANLAPINTHRMPDVNPTLPPGYHALNVLLNASNPTPPPTPVGSPSGPPFPGHPIPGFNPTLPQFPSGNPNPSGTISSITPNLQIPVGGQGGTIPFPLPGHNPIATQVPVGTQSTIGGLTSPFGQNIPPELAQYWNQILQNFPQNDGGQQIVPTMGQPYPGITNPIWGQSHTTQPQVPTQTQGYHPWNYYPHQPPPNQPGSSHYGQTAYGPTGLPTGLPPQSHQYPQVNIQLPFLATLDLPDLSRILNDPIRHSPQWLVIPAKLPLDIPKFDGKVGEDTNNHVMMFHLWCSSNSLMDDSIRLRLFQRTLTGSAAKWYIELPRGFFSDFNTLAMDFLTHYQLLIHYDTGTEILTSFKQTKGTHISDHIHEWRRRRRLIKLELPDQLLAEWFTKSFVNEIGKDIAMGGIVTEE